MAIALVQQSTPVHAGAASVTSTFGATPTAGNLLLAIAGATGSTSTFTTPAGWAVLVSHTGTGVGTAIFWKVAGASEPTGLTVTTTGTGSDLTLAEFSGFPVAIADVTANHDTGASTVTTSVTGTTAATGGVGDLAVCCMEVSANVTAPAVDSGFTLLTAGTRIISAYKVLTGSPTTGATFTWTTATKASAVVGTVSPAAIVAAGFTGWGIPL